MLIAQAVGRLLADDLAMLGADAAAATAPGVFASLDPLLAAAPEPVVAAVFARGGALLKDPALGRALAAQLNRYSEKLRPGLARARLATAGEAAPVSIALDVQVCEGRVALAARLSAGAETIDVPTGPWQTLPGRGALLPPLLAIVIALAFGRILLALFAGIYVGAVLAAIDAGTGMLPALGVGLFDVFAVYLRSELFDSFRVEIIGFVVALVAMVGVMSRAGGVQGLVDRLLVFARTARSALFLTWGMGLLIFFDDYANCMLVGSTMRPLTDRLRISREKLAYIVDSTAAPIAGLSLLSTWIAFQVSVFSAQLPEVGIRDGGYAMFIESLPYRYYCWLTLLFVPATIATSRDFGPMAKAERRAHREGLLVRPGGRAAISSQLASLGPAPQMVPDWRVSAAPVALTLVVTALRIFADGGGLELLRGDPGSLRSLEGFTAVMLKGGGAGPIFAGACAGLLLALFLAGSRAVRVALVLGTGAGLASTWAGAGLLAPAVGEVMAGYGAFAIGAACIGAATWWATARWVAATHRPHLVTRELWQAGTSGAGTLGFAVVLLFEAWMIGAVCRDLSTADYLVALLSGALPPVLLPLLLFVAACAVAFATGSSWSTMSILLPNVVALAAALGEQTVLGSFGMVAVAIAAVLDGAIFGDHCSPISDTTVLSSVASGSDHVDHVRTQAPYALVTAGLAVACGYLPVSLFADWSFAWALTAGAVGIAIALFGFGKRREG